MGILDKVAALLSPFSQPTTRCVACESRDIEWIFHDTYRCNGCGHEGGDGVPAYQEMLAALPGLAELDGLDSAARRREALGALAAARGALTAALLAARSGPTHVVSMEELREALAKEAADLVKDMAASAVAELVGTVWDPDFDPVEDGSCWGVERPTDEVVQAGRAATQAREALRRAWYLLWRHPSGPLPSLPPPGRWERTFWEPTFTSSWAPVAIQEKEGLARWIDEVAARLDEVPGG